jgi:hypothetical protein
MKILSNKAHDEWGKLSKEEKRKITLEAIGFGFCNDEEDEFDISYLHVIACHYETEREHKQYMKILDIMHPFINELCDVFQSNLFKSTVKRLKAISNRLEKLIDKATD